MRINDRSFRPCAVILAAGASRRMGQSKLLLPWGGGTVLGHLVRQWRALEVSPVAAVVAEGQENLSRELDRLGVAERVVNPEPDRGMFSSIQAASQWEGWSEAITHWILSLGDQPLVEMETLGGLVRFAREHPDKICQPSHKGRLRHPVIFPRDVFLELGSSSAEHLKGFLEDRRRKRAGYSCEDEGLELDLDTPEDYREAVRRSGQVLI